MCSQIENSMKWFLSNLPFQVNISLYLYQDGYILSKGTYGELKHFIKLLIRLETSSTFLNFTRKFHRKSRFTIFDWSKITFNRSSTLFDRSNKNWTAIETSRNSRIFSLPFLIDWAKVLTDRKYWFSIFHLENSRTWIFTLWNHILQT